jgi:hypothetical protein
MDASLLRLKCIFRHVPGKKGTLLEQALRKGRVQHEDTSRSAANVRPEKLKASDLKGRRRARSRKPPRGCTSPTFGVPTEAMFRHACAMGV